MLKPGLGPFATADAAGIGRTAGFRLSVTRGTSQP